MTESQHPTSLEAAKVSYSDRFTELSNLGFIVVESGLTRLTSEVLCVSGVGKYFLRVF
jgi:hypothetical protein